MSERWVLLVAIAIIAVVALLAWPAPPSVATRLSGGPALAPPRPEGLAPVATFSIVAFDSETGDLGVAVESKFFAVGPVVPFAEAGVGAVATQSYANTSYGPRGLEMLRGGMPAADVVAALTEGDEGREVRQLGIVDAQGRAATFTGSSCLPWAGGRTGSGYTVQGNILAGAAVVDAMARAFEVTEGDLATRMVAALAAGQAAGGDARGRQSAALVVVRSGGGYGGYNDRYIDLRVDDHPTPIVELQRLLDIRHAQMLAGAAQSQIQRSEAAAGEQRTQILQESRSTLREVIHLNPADGWSWLLLANVELQLGDGEAAAAAGIRALRTDPWIKTAVIQGISGRDRLVEPLLGLAPFREIWETLSARQ
jgi:uncharacterized Ntn-hydrolase superfamily protein